MMQSDPIQLISRVLWSPYAILHYLVVKVIIICLFCSILTAILHHFGFTHRLLQLWLEREASAIANHAPISVSRIDVHLIDFFTLKSTIRLYDSVIHTPNPNADTDHKCGWQWESPLIARIGYAEVSFNLWSLIDFPIWFKERTGIRMDVVRDLYSIGMNDVQVFVEKRRNVFNFHLLDERLDLPEAKDVIESMNISDGTTNVSSVSNENGVISNGIGRGSAAINDFSSGSGATEKETAGNNALHMNGNSNDSGVSNNTSNNTAGLKAALDTKEDHTVAPSGNNDIGSANDTNPANTNTCHNGTKKNKTSEHFKNTSITSAASTSTSISSFSSNGALNRLDMGNDSTEQQANQEQHENFGDGGNDRSKLNDAVEEIEDEGAKKAKELVMQIVGAVSTLGRAANEGGTQALSDELRNQKDGFVSHLKNVQAMVGLSIDETRKTKNMSKNSTTTSIDIAKEGIQVIKQVGKVVEKNVLNMKEQVDALSKPPPFRKDWVPLENPPLFRIGVIAIRDVRIFTKNIIVVAGAQKQKQLQVNIQHGTSGGIGGSDNSSSSKNVRFQDHANLSTNAIGWSKPIHVEEVKLYPSELCPPRRHYSSGENGHEKNVDDETMLNLVAQPIENICNLVLERIITEMAKSTTGQLLSNAFTDVFALFDIAGMSRNTIGAGGGIGTITRSNTRDTVDL